MLLCDVLFLCVIQVTRSTKEAMMVDMGSRDIAFIDAIKSIRSSIVKVAGLDEKEWTMVPIQGSGTFGVEAVISWYVHG